MKIVLCCAGGFSTTMLMDSMKKTVKDSAKLNIDDFQFTAIPVDLLQSGRYGCACHRTADCTQNRLHQADHRSVPYSLCYRRQGYVWKNGWSHGYENGIDRKKKSRYAEIILRGIIKKKARVETCLINLRHL